MDLFFAKFQLDHQEDFYLSKLIWFETLWCCHSWHLCRSCRDNLRTSTWWSTPKHPTLGNTDWIKIQKWIKIQEWIGQDLPVDDNDPHVQHHWSSQDICYLLHQKHTVSMLWQFSYPWDVQLYFHPCKKADFSNCNSMNSPTWFAIFYP